MRRIGLDKKTAKKFKTASATAGIIFCGAFIALNYIAKKNYPKSVYADQPEERSLFEGKKVVFVEDENDPVNADGKSGHLEAVGASEHTPTFYEKYVKRGLDIMLSTCGMIVLAPVYAVSALAIKIDDPGPAIFYQKRVGVSKSFFRLAKYRSMKMDTPHNVPTHQLSDPQKYLLRSGRILRKFSIDELPQLTNILMGNMSIIGPRPALWNQDYLTAERDKYGANDIKPGLTGLAQISGRDELEIPEKARLDGVYAQAFNSKGKGKLRANIEPFVMDCKVFFGSIFAVLKQKGIVEGGTGMIAKEAEKAKEL